MTENVTKLPIEKTKQAATAPAPGWSTFDGLRQEINRLFDDFNSLAWPIPLRHAMPSLDLSRDKGWPVAPAMDMTEADGHYAITAELPGMDEKNVEVKVANGILTIKGEKKEEKEEQNKDYHLSERRYGSFQRSFRIPEGVDPDAIAAEFSKGLLTIRLPKSQTARNNEKKIEVKAGG